jgi:hypothetical protein
MRKKGKGKKGKERKCKKECMCTRNFAWAGLEENPPGTKKLTKISGTKKMHFLANQFFDDVAFCTIC